MPELSFASSKSPAATASPSAPAAGDAATFSSASATSTAAGDGVGGTRNAGGTRRWRWLAAAILVLAAILRLWQLDLRPAHFDEGVNGMFIDRMQANGFYKYDPKNYHGPLHFYALFLSKVLFGRDLWALRLPTALISLAAVALALKFSRFFGRPIAGLAALGLALSPACVYFGRDAIHESWLLYFLLLTLYGIYGLWRDNRRQDLWALGLGLTGMVLTKETYIIHVTCFLAAGCVLFLWENIRPSHAPPGRLPAGDWTGRDALAVAAVCLGLIVLFYTGTFFNPSGLQGIFTTFSSWAQKSVEGEGHRKFWHYWLRLLWWREAWALGGLILGVLWLAWSRRDWQMRYLAIYSTGALVAYSIVPYKTPWCILAMVWPFFFLAAAGLVALARFGRTGPVAAALAVVALAGWTGWQTWLVNFRHYADDDEPYSYVQTSTQVDRIISPLLALVRDRPANFHRSGLVLSNSPHPLPWLLGDFSNVGYFYLPRRPTNYNVDFLIVADDRIGEAEEKLTDRYFRETNITLRPALGPMALYLRASVFAPLLPPGRVPEFDPGEGVVSVGAAQRETTPEDGAGSEAEEGEMDEESEGVITEEEGGGSAAESPAGAAAANASAPGAAAATAATAGAPAAPAAQSAGAASPR